MPVKHVVRHKTRHHSTVKPKHKSPTVHHHGKGFFASIGSFFKNTAKKIWSFAGSVEKKAEGVISSVYKDVKNVAAFGGNLVTKTRDDVIGLGQGVLSTGKIVVIGVIALLALIVFNARNIAGAAAQIKQSI